MLQDACALPSLHFAVGWRRWWFVNTLQRIATHCNTLQHTATPKTQPVNRSDEECFKTHAHCPRCTALAVTVLMVCQQTVKHCTHCDTLQHTASHCKTLQHSATHSCCTVVLRCWCKKLPSCHTWEGITSYECVYVCTCMCMYVYAPCYVYVCDFKFVCI